MGRHLKYKGVTVNALGIPLFGPDKKEDKTLPLGRKHYQYYRSFNHNFSNTAPKDLVIMYDIPYNKRKERDWFRSQLKKFDYIMIQKSVWVGPSPLPKDFLSYVKSIGLLSKLKTLKLAKPYSRGEDNM